MKQTTQFIVGPAGESDSEIVKYMWGLYDRLRLHRIYFSAYQKGLGDSSLPAEREEGCGGRRQVRAGAPALPSGLPDAQVRLPGYRYRRSTSAAICRWRRTRRRSGPPHHPEFFPGQCEPGLPAGAAAGARSGPGDGQSPSRAAAATAARRARCARGPWGFGCERRNHIWPFEYFDCQGTAAFYNSQAGLGYHVRKGTRGDPPEAG